MAIDLNDKTSNGNNLTNNNSASEVTSSLPFAGSTIAVDFEKDSSQYLSISDASQTGLDLTNNFTLECWFKLETFTSGVTYMMISKFDATPQLSYAFGVFNSSGTHQFRFYWTSDGDWGTFQDLFKNTGTLNTGTWYHGAVTFSSGTVEFFLNGSSLGTSSGTGNVKSGSSTFKIGTENTNYFDGVIDEVRIWNDIRTSTEINNNKSVELVGNESNLVAYWPFESLGSPSPSLSPSASPSPSPSLSPSSSQSPSASPSASESRSPSSSQSPSASPSASESRSPSASQSPSASPSASQSPSSSASASTSLSPSLSGSPSPSLSPSASQSPSASESPSPSATPSSSPSASESRSESLSMSATPSASPSLSESLSPSATPSSSPSASQSPSSSASSSISLSPSLSPSASPSSSISASPSVAFYIDKYTENDPCEVNPDYQDKYSDNNPTYQDKYSDNNPTYQDKYRNFY